MLTRLVWTRHSRYVKVIQTASSVRSLSVTPIARKKNGRIVPDDLFLDVNVKEIEQIAYPVSEQVNPSSPTPTPAILASDADSSTILKATRPLMRGKLNAEQRLARFNMLYEFVSQRIGRRPAVKTPQVRKSAWVHLIGLAATEGQLNKVAGMFPQWKDSGWEFGDHVAELFVRRCEELSCPLLALNVFGDYSKYNIKLSLPAARHLIHSLHVQHPVDKTIAAAALYNVYGLPPISQDLISCSMVASACFKHNTRDSLIVANALMPHLRTVLTQSAPLKVSRDRTMKAFDKTKSWVKWSLKKVDKALKVQNRGEASEYVWLNIWRRRSGHLSVGN